MTPEEKKIIKARKLVAAVNRLAKKQGLNFFIVTDGASGISNNGNPAVRNAREAQIKWELEHGADPYEDWSKQVPKPISFPEDEIESLKNRDSIITHRISAERGKYNKGDEVVVPWGDRYVVSDRSDLASVEDSPYKEYLTPEQKKELTKKKIALLTLSKKAQAYDRKKWPDYDEYQKKHHDEIVAKVERIIREHFAKMRPWAIKTKGGKFIQKKDLTEDDIKDAIVRTGNAALRARRGVCHDLANARYKMLKDRGIDVSRLFVDWEDVHANDGLLGHSMVFFKGEDGKYHYGNPHMAEKSRNAFGEFDDLTDAVRQYIATIKSDGGLNDEEPFTVYDTSLVEYPEIVPYAEYAELSRRGKRILDQGHEKKAESYSLKEDPTYEDALKVFDKLDFDDRANLVPRHPDFLRKVPDDMLFDRQVVVDGKGDPVGFQEFYSRKDKSGRRLSPHNIIAVAPEARGNGLAKIMVEAAVRKARKEKVKRLLWEAFADNEPSIRAALSAGFEDATPKSAKGHRKLVYNVSEKKADIVTKLLPHQENAVRKALLGDIILAHSLGSGKTLSSIAAIDAIGKPATVLAPASLVENYRKELRKHKKGGPDVTVISLPTAVSKGYRIPKGNTVVIDEAHSLRNQGTKRERYVIDQLKNAGRVIALTGTPSYNDPYDIAQLVNIVSRKDVFPRDRSEFYDRYFDDEEVKVPALARLFMGVRPGKKTVINRRRSNELRDRLREFVDEVDIKRDLPSVSTEDIYVDMDPEQLDAYNYVTRNLPSDLLYKLRHNIAQNKTETKRLQAFLGAARQVSNTAEVVDLDAKGSRKLSQAVQRLARFFDDNKDARALVYSNYLAAGVYPYARHLDDLGLKYNMFTGGMSPGQKKRVVEQYNSGEVPIILGSGSASEGLDLKGTRLIQLLEPHWNNSRLNQVIGRGVRYKSHEGLPENERNVKVERYYSRLPEKGIIVKRRRSGVDEYLRDRSAEKQELIDSIRKLLEKRKDEEDNDSLTRE